MEKQQIIEKTIDFVKETLAGAEAGHDWWHTYRVCKLAKHIAKEENADLFIVELGALLHDIADAKFHSGDEEAGARKAKEFLISLNVDKEIVEHIEKIIANVSFKGGKVPQTFKSPELDAIQDADRLDSMGAMGIARVFSYGGYKNRPIYDPNQKPRLNMSREEYRKHDSTSINHFYEKLLRLKDRMNTITGKKLAEHRHKFMQQFLDEFYKEWEGEV